MKSKFTNKEMIAEWLKVPERVVQEFGDKGDFARQHLLTPHIFELLGDIKNKTVFDAICGNGYLSRMMAKKGAKVTAIESSSAAFTYATEKEKEENLGIMYIQSSLAPFVTKKTFDIVVGNMIFTDVPDFQTPMLSAMKIVKKNGAFIISIGHPCFEMSGKEWRHLGYVKVNEYFEEYATKYIIGYRFHRPLSMYINFLADNGFFVEKMIEPQLTQREVRDNVDYAKDVHVPSFLIIKARKLRE